MPATPTARLGIPLPSQTDPADVPTDLGKLANAIDPLVASFGQGAGLSSRPAAGQQGRIWAHQPGTNASPPLPGTALSYDDGTSWSHIGSSVPVLNVPGPSPGVTNTNALPKTSDCDDGQEVLINIPTIPKGGFWQQQQNSAMWHLRLYKAINWWVVLGDMALRSDFSSSGTSSTYAATTGGPVASATAQRVIIPIPGRYDFDLYQRVSSSVAANVNAYVGTYDFTNRVWTTAWSWQAAANALYAISVRRPLGTVTIPASYAIDIGYNASVATTMTVGDASLAVYPRLITPNN